MNSGDIFRRPTVEDQVRRQVEQYLDHHSYVEKYRVVPLQTAIDMCVNLTKHLTERLEAYEKIAADQMMLGLKTSVMPNTPQHQWTDEEYKRVAEDQQNRLVKKK